MYILCIYLNQCVQYKKSIYYVYTFGNGLLPVTDSTDISISKNAVRVERTDWQCNGKASLQSLRDESPRIQTWDEVSLQTM